MSDFAFCELRFLMCFGGFSGPHGDVASAVASLAPSPHRVDGCLFVVLPRHFLLISQNQ